MQLPLLELGISRESLYQYLARKMFLGRKGSSGRAISESFPMARIWHGPISRIEPRLGKARLTCAFTRGRVGDKTRLSSHCV